MYIVIHVFKSCLLPPIIFMIAKLCSLSVADVITVVLITQVMFLVGMYQYESVLYDITRSVCWVMGNEDEPGPGQDITELQNTSDMLIMF